MNEFNNKVTITGVYKITCLSNNKFYIGSSKDINNRWLVHKRRLSYNNHTNPHLQSAFNKYGVDYFKFEIIEECLEINLIDREQFWMDKTNCYDRCIGFNNCIKADRPLGYKHTDEAKLKMSTLKKGKRILSDSVYKKIANKRRGQKHSEETKLKLSLCKQGSLNPRFGVKESEEHKTKRMKNFLNAPKWNKGLTKKDDPRLEKLAVWKDKLPPNALKCTLKDLETGETWEEDSLRGLSDICTVSLSTLNRLRANTVGNKMRNKYKLQIN